MSAPGRPSNQDSNDDVVVLSSGPNPAPRNIGHQNRLMLPHPPNIALQLNLMSNFPMIAHPNISTTVPPTSQQQAQAIWVPPRTIPPMICHYGAPSNPVRIKNRGNKNVELHNTLNRKLLEVYDLTAEKRRMSQRIQENEERIGYLEMERQRESAELETAQGKILEQQKAIEEKEKEVTALKAELEGEKEKSSAAKLEAQVRQNQVLINHVQIVQQMQLQFGETIGSLKSELEARSRIALEKEEAWKKEREELMEKIRAASNGCLQ